MTAIFALLVACAEETPPPVAPPPLPTDWHECVRQGAIRRARCPRHFQQCGDRAAALGIDCYRAVYQKQQAAPDPTLKGPRWAYEQAQADAGAMDPKAFAQEVCRHELTSSPRDACVDEVLFGLDVPFAAGFGAGP